MLIAINKQKEKFGPEKKEPKPSGPKKHRYIKPLVENYGRNQRGSRLVKQELNKLIDDQSRFFPLRSMKDSTGTQVRFTDSGTNGQLSLEELLLKAPHFFSCYFHHVRNKIAYGTKLHSWLQKVTCQTRLLKFCIPTFTFIVLERWPCRILAHSFVHFIFNLS